MGNMIYLIIGCIIFLKSYDLAFDFTGAILDKEFNVENIEFYTYNIKKVNRLRVLANCAPAAYFFYTTIIQKKTITNLQKISVNILLVKAAISISAMNSPYLSRMGIYISPFQILSLSELIKHLPVKTRNTIMYLMCLFYGIFFYFEVHGAAKLKHFYFIWDR